MNPDSSTDATLRRTHEWIALALLALAAGIAVYVWARPQAAMFLPGTWHQPLNWRPSTPLSGVLPTFVHALALPLLIAAASGTNGRRSARGVCAAWCVVEVALESAQHRALGGALLAQLPLQTPWAELCKPLAAYVRNGTFDRLDVIAALLGSLTAYRILCRPAQRTAANRETRHV